MRGLPAIRHALAVIVAAVLMINAAPARTPRIALDDDTLRAFIGSFAHVKRKAEELGGEKAPDDFAAASAPLATLIASVDRRAMDRVVQSQGFRDFDAWTEVLSAISSAYAHIVGLQYLRRHQQSAFRMIDGDTGLSGEQRSILATSLRATLQVFLKTRPPRGDLDAVTPYLETLADIFSSTPPHRESAPESKTPRLEEPRGVG